mmetsp:Transcript_34212/g.41920  ORF Transcript_34212/g.41920 Transcript_34212/m.41920 type:complete len:191 (-) Transcript_34212:1100-1672(-)|eukprot:CAMPEP_0172480968 /NCGR_PEP_ID=MMETSP1066-20121228/6497_1 /TAXON_ID=671091 /ORGANISM="Coscinodiscus wailesii, Strain CCMP2513" /LENGTH=190 /DNA_ID=CAMNT_0013242821 /DNA_START=18 /DNA_END=590 /DNA_ORIENTATION=+
MKKSGLLLKKSKDNTTHQNAHPNLDKDALDEIKEAFQLFDTQQTDKINIREIKATFRALGFQLKKADVRSLISEHDIPVGRQREYVTFDEFVRMASPRIAARDPYEEIRQIFALIDEDGTGGISFRNLKAVALELGENYSDEELQEMINEADRDGDGVINEDEFYRVMRKKSGDPLDELDSDEEDEAETA